MKDCPDRIAFEDWNTTGKYKLVMCYGIFVVFTYKTY